VQKFSGLGEKIFARRPFAGLPPFSAPPAGGAALIRRLFLKNFLAKIQLVGVRVLLVVSSNFF